jgi:lysozyme family protein
MPDVRQIAEEIVAREGGFVNDPDDPGSMGPMCGH